eukprot:scaffold52075_cov69-Phaeocystis_antarctica.AAC.2
MSVTLDVSRLSGWLNASAHCRVEEGGVGGGAACGPGGGRAGGGSGASSALEGPNRGGGWQGTRGAHLKHANHVCDFGRVEAQRLVERRRAHKHVAHFCDAGRVPAR